MSPAVQEALAQFNRGAALLEQYQYVEAAEAFGQVLAAAPEWRAARFNLGLALLNMQEDSGAAENLQRARKAFESVLQEDPNHLSARFCLGLLHQHTGDNGQAMACFQKVYESDPQDPHVAYKYAETLISLDRKEPAVEILAQIVVADPGFVSAIYRLATLYQRSGRREEAKTLFNRFRELKTAELTGGTFAVLNSYGTVGKYYLALGADDLPLPRAQSTQQRILLSPDFKRLSDPTSPWEASGVQVNLPGVAVGDIDADGDLDLCLTALSADGTTALWLNDGTGTFTKGQILTAQGLCPSLGDVDNDGDLDLWLGRSGTDRYFANDGTGRFQPVELPGVAPEDVSTQSARLLDIDSDGDLDLLAFHLNAGSVPAGIPAQARAGNLYNNNRDGSFADIAEKLGLTFETSAIAAAVFDDFDNDRDLDLIVFPQDGPPLGWINDRVWQYRVQDAEDLGLAQLEHVVGVTSGDPDADGDRDLLIFTREAIRLYLNSGSFAFEQHGDFTERCGRAGASGGQFADMDNDGDLDIVVADQARRNGQRGPALFVNEWPRRRFTDVTELDRGNLLAAVTFAGYASCVAADFNQDGTCDILLAPAGAAPFLIENATEGGHWIGVDLQGTQGQDGKSRSNNSAIGARVDIKTGVIAQQHVVGTPSGPVASGPLRIHAGLGSHATVDWLRVTWPDAVLQAELELPADQVVKVVEIQRKVSSCPHLFAWNGSYVEFVSDFGGMGGLGYLAEPGVYAQPDSTEYVPVPNLEPRDGEYVLHVVEPIEEIVYLDETKLMAIDHPAGTRIYPNEMMAVNTSPPDFEIFCIEGAIDPVRATDHRDVDVTEAIKAVDRVYAGPVRPDRRFVGYAEEHFVEMDFGSRLSSLAPDARLVLFLHGWVHYGYSSTNFSAAQAGLRLQAPSIYVERDGQWVELFHEVGYPAGIRHTMTLDVTGKLLPTDRRLRVVTNMELYWDQIFLAPVLMQAPLRTQAIAVDSAELRFLGYPREYSPDGKKPDLYDYSQVDRTTPWKTMRGAYTRYGDVTNLLGEPDDCYVIMGPGEEVTLRFAAAGFAPVKAGYERSFILKTDSYCKDMDLYTVHPETVEPLPHHGMSEYPYGPDQAYPQDEKHQEYHQEYNTRYIR
ncbi:MAG: VCBS repeat-containing protein [Phycisphaerales bacterium]|nr:MAG: VCBS repeat-containing protein [Phycisphaerales bacterium]